jgi:hypothetical protein
MAVLSSQIKCEKKDLRREKRGSTLPTVTGPDPLYFRIWR